MPSSPISGVAEKFVYRPVLSLYIRAVKLFALGGVLAILTAPIFPLLNYYACLFLAGLESLPLSEVYASESAVFWPGVFVSTAIFVMSAGGLYRLGLTGFVGPLRQVEPFVRRLTGELSADELREILVQLSRIPAALAVLAVAIFVLQIVSLYLWSFMKTGSFLHIRLFLLIDFFIAIILIGMIYSISEFACSYLRMQVKRQLSGLGINSNDIISGRSGVIRFVYLLFVGGISTIALIVFLHNKSNHALVEAISFSAITFLICGSLAVIYFYTWTYSLKQISDATYDVAMGGRGQLPLLSNDSEMIEVAVNFDSATYEINTIREYLTSLVDEKTRAISQAYKELNQLKSRQDGDYYLTSNLIESLNEIRPESDTVIVDSLIRQYKIFDFMGHIREIGGDMNAGYALRLQGEKYTLVVNADAMGKSLQGAGGVLVLGSALRSLVERTRITAGLRNLSPERWLKNAFLELHRLFANFNGSMMASMICLLIHDKTGYTVMINAEHPKGILLRAMNAEFISQHDGLRKLGNTAVKGRLWVDTFDLKKGDIVILGSDGRDDLVIGSDADDQPIMNEDDRKILTITRAAGGDLPRIFLGLKNMGEIVDDISLLRVEFSPTEVARDAAQINVIFENARKLKDGSEKADILWKVLQLDLDNTRAWGALLLQHLRSDRLADAAFITECLVRIRPGRDFYLYAAALVHYRLANYEKALNFCDRLTLRNWQVPRFLVLLGKIHEARQDDEGMYEAGMLIDELAPGDSYAARLIAAKRQ